MIILDTNVVSELMKRANASLSVRSWLDLQVPETLYLTSTVLSELLVGLQLIPEGRRKQGLTDVLDLFIQEVIGKRISPFDAIAAHAYASIVGRARIKGFSMPVADGQIAAIAEVHGFTVATRDVAPFLAAGVKVINPWVAQSS